VQAIETKGDFEPVRRFLKSSKAQTYIPVCSTFAIPPVAMVKVNHAQVTCFRRWLQGSDFGPASKEFDESPGPSMSVSVLELEPLVNTFGIRGCQQLELRSDSVHRRNTLGLQ
jgi:hypothetical protein